MARSYDICDRERVPSLWTGYDMKDIISYKCQLKKEQKTYKGSADLINILNANVIIFMIFMWL